jgi:hypothetical protein
MVESMSDGDALSTVNGNVVGASTGIYHDGRGDE